MIPTPAPRVAELAGQFCYEIRRSLTPDQLKTVILRNRLPEYKGACATHDFIDANMSMLRAYVDLTGMDADDVDTSDARVLKIMSDAWDQARESAFSLTYRPRYQFEEGEDKHVYSIVDTHATTATGAVLSPQAVCRILNIAAEMVRATVGKS